MIKLTELNDDCFLHILSFIINIRERICLRQVCRHFDRLVKRSLEQCPVKLIERSHLFYPSERIFDLDLSKIFDCCAIITHLKLTDPLILDRLPQASSLAHLKYLEIIADQDKRFIKYIDPFLLGCVNLKQLIIEACEPITSSFQYWPPSLVQLDITCFDFPAQLVLKLTDHLRHYGQSLEKIKLLAISHRSQPFTEQLCQSIWDHCHNLQMICLLGSKIRFPAECQQLHKLEILVFHCHFKSIDGVGKIMSRCPNIQLARFIANGRQIYKFVRPPNAT